ncbi:oleate hydratase [Burkholderia diffusa]|nr:oleate hydratase [Burkholderia diffusa]
MTHIKPIRRRTRITGPRTLANCSFALRPPRTSTEVSTNLPKGFSMQRSTQDSDRAARRRAAGIDRDSSRFYLVGGGIASMAAAAFLIRDGAMPHDAALERHAMQHSRFDDQDGI